MPPEQAIGAVDQIDARSDVFGLGGILCAGLTGRPPFVGDTSESIRQSAAKGKVADAFARLDACAADRDLVALCKRCLSPEKGDRPADAGEVARAVADLRAAADERARQAELDRVRVEGERATAEARAAERRKRRRVWTGAAVALTLAIVGGLGAVLVVQHRANADLAAKNVELADEQAKVQARFKLAQNAIKTFHTGVSEDVLLKNDQFRELRSRLLKEAAGFYGQLEELLAGQTDARSRSALADGYAELGGLTEKIGSREEALAVHRKALAIRRELAAPGADEEPRLDVIRSLQSVGLLMQSTGDAKGAVATYEEMRDAAEKLAAENPAKEVLFYAATSHLLIAGVLTSMSKPAEAMESFKRSQAIHQRVADADPAYVVNLNGLAVAYKDMGLLLSSSGKPAEALEAYKKALEIQQRAADAKPDVTLYQTNVAQCYNNIGNALSDANKSEEAMAAYQQALAIQQKLVDANPAVTEFQSDVAMSHINIGAILADDGRPAESLASFTKAAALLGKLVDANPGVKEFQYFLAMTYGNVGEVHSNQKRFADAYPSLDKSVALYQKLVDEQPDNSDYTDGLGLVYQARGRARFYSGQPAGAASDLRHAVELFDKTASLTLNGRFERSRSLALLVGLGGDAKSGVTAAEAAKLADRAVVALKGAVDAGWSKAAVLKEADFDPVRGREDFRNLVKELEAKGAVKDLPAKPAEKK